VKTYTICTRRTPAGEFIGAARPDCSHTTLVHPSLANPGIESCVICQLVAVKAIAGE